MPRLDRVRAAVLAGATLLFAACDQPTAPVTPTGPAVAGLQQATGGQNPDQHALGRAVPAFGGLFLEDGMPTVFLTDRSQRGAIARELAAFLAHRGVSQSELRVRQARFTYRELEDFFDRARGEAFAGPGGVFADLDEANNRITLGVENSAAAARVKAAVASLGLPAGAVEVVLAPPILPLQTLRDRFDPIPAGVQIHFGNFVCSIGIIAQVGGQPHFVTASHCTNQQGGVEGTQYYQPLSSTDGTVIGIEAADPDYYNFRQGPCPYAGAKCRKSDAALIASTGARAYRLGSIADPTSGIQWNGDYFDVSFVASGNGVVGDTRHKVGRTTGHTTGQVTASCVDTGVSGSNIVQLCQDWVEGSGRIVAGGDSGSPTFAGTSNVTWWGILWGGSSDGSTLVYSPASNVQEELGTLDVTGGGGSEPPPETLDASFTYSCQKNSCTFNASSSTGATTYDWDFGDGAPASGVTTSHAYATAGDFVVTLTVGDGSATDTAMQTISCLNRGPNLQCR